MPNDIVGKLDHITAMAELWDGSGMGRVRGITRTVNEIKVLLADPRPSAAMEAIKFALLHENGRDFLVLWYTGCWDTIRRDFPEAPEAVYG